MSKDAPATRPNAPSSGRWRRSRWKILAQQAALEDCHVRRQANWESRFLGLSMPDYVTIPIYDRPNAPIGERIIIGVGIFDRDLRDSTYGPNGPNGQFLGLMSDYLPKDYDFSGGVSQWESFTSTLVPGNYAETRFTYQAFTQLLEETGDPIFNNLRNEVLIPYMEDLSKYGIDKAYGLPPNSVEDLVSSLGNILINGIVDRAISGFIPQFFVTKGFEYIFDEFFVNQVFSDEPADYSFTLIYPGDSAFYANNDSDFHVLSDAVDTSAATGDGNDIVFGNIGDDTLEGGAGSDTLIGSAGNDVLLAGEGGADSIDGGAGFDKLTLRRDGVTEGFSFALDASSGGGGFTLSDGTEVSNIEQLDFYSGSGDDQASFKIFAGSGMYGFAGAEGEDHGSADFTGMSGDISTGGGLDQFGANVNFVISNQGAPSDGVIFGNTEHLTVFGGSGDDSLGGRSNRTYHLEGNDGNDRLIGASLDDLLIGGEGDDTLEGGSGSDTLIGGAGNDVMQGGSGSDTFDINPGGEGITIVDFELGIDVLDLRDFGRADVLAALEDAQTGSAMLTFSDGTVLNVEGAGVSSDTLSEDDLILAPTSAPDIAVQNVSLSSTFLQPGDTISIDWDVVNIGSGDATSGGQTYISLSADQTLDGSDTILHNESFPQLASGSSDPANQSGLTIPTGLEPSTYYILTTASPVSGEINAANNTIVTTISINEPTTPGSPDLASSDLAISNAIWTYGETIDFSWVTSNLGSSDAALNFDGIHLSIDPTVTLSDRSLGGTQGVSIVGSTSNQEWSYEIRPDQLSPGTYYVAAIADVFGDVVESDETNNASSVIQIEIQASDTGTPVQLTTTILNSGNSNINLDGATNEFTDFGGQDTYTLLTSLSADVTIADNNPSTINLPEGIVVTSALFLADGAQFTINGNTVTLLGDPASFDFVFGGTPLDPNAGTTLSFAQTANEFGTSLPSQGGTPNAATVFGAVQADGTLGETSSFASLVGMSDDQHSSDYFSG